MSLPKKGRLKIPSDRQLAILRPATVGKHEAYAPSVSGKAHGQNSGLDSNRDRKVTNAECTASLQAMKIEGTKPASMA